MKYYDARIIEGCCVFSYTVDGPSSQTEKTAEPVSHKKTAEKEKRADGFFKKLLLPFFFLLLAPFAIVADAVWFAVKKLADAFRLVVKECMRGREIAACILTAISSTAIIPLLFLFF